MTTHPNCKINLGLQVTTRRADGYHELQTIFLPVPLCDTLTIATAEHFEFTGSGIAIDCPDEQNICVKAYRLMQAEHPHIEPVHIHLDKHIPFGAGLGGGSSDAAHTLMMLNELFNLGHTNVQLCDMAAQLGADCPFFVINQPCFATGIGDQLKPLNIQAFNNSNIQTILLKPPVSVSTADAYRGIVPHRSDTDLCKAIQQPFETWRDTIVNDFEATVFKKYPIIGDLKQTLYNSGAVYASMSGSGSAVFGLFKELPNESLPYEIYRGTL